MVVNGFSITQKGVLMKTSVCVVLVALMVLSVPHDGTAMSLFPRDPIISMNARISCPYITTTGGTAFLNIEVVTRDFRPVDRRPMNISVVLDRSGSMAVEGKIENAKATLLSLVNQLRPNDILSIVIYDDVVEVLRGARRVDNKNEIRRLVEGVYPRGSTNLGGGMVEGFRQVECNLGKEYVNRVVLLSDGLANRGIVDPSELNRIARRYRSKSISLTTMGVGLEYNENLMVGLSENGGGNYYFIESAYGLASIMQKEFNLIAAVLAQNATIELKLGRGVRVRDAIGCDHSGDGERHFIRLGDLYANDRREFTVELEIPEGTGSLRVVKGYLRFESSDVSPRSVAPFSVDIYYTRDVAEVEKNRDWDTQAKADVAVSTRRVETALKALDEGRSEEAMKELKDARRDLAAAPAAVSSASGAAMIREQEEKLRSYTDSLAAAKDDTRKVKKSIQYENYMSQKKK
jgi:Ca-activated chloride channel family protein